MSNLTILDSSDHFRHTLKISESREDGKCVMVFERIFITEELQMFYYTETHAVKLGNPFADDYDPTVEKTYSLVQEYTGDKKTRKMGAIFKSMFMNDELSCTEVVAQKNKNLHLELDKTRERNTLQYKSGLEDGRDEELAHSREILRLISDASDCGLDDVINYITTVEIERIDKIRGVSEDDNPFK